MKLVNIKKELGTKFDKIIQKFRTANENIQQERTIRILTEAKQHYLQKLDEYANEYHERIDDAFTVQVSHLYINMRAQFSEYLENINTRKNAIISTKNPGSLSISTGFPSALKAVEKLRMQLSDDVSQSIIDFKVDFTGVEKPPIEKTILKDISDKSLVQEIAHIIDQTFKKIDLTDDYGFRSFKEKAEGHKAALRQELQRYISKVDAAIIEMEENIHSKKAQYEAKQKEEQLAKEKAKQIEEARREREAAAECERLRLADISHKENELLTICKNKVELLAKTYMQFESRIVQLEPLRTDEDEKNIAHLLIDIDKSLASAKDLIQNFPNGLTIICLQQMANKALKQVSDIKDKLETRKHNLKMISGMVKPQKELLNRFLENENNTFTFFAKRSFTRSHVDTSSQKFSELANAFAANAEALNKMQMPNEREIEFNLFKHEKETLLKIAEHYQQSCKSRLNYYHKEANHVHVTNLVSRLLMSEHLEKLINHANNIAKKGKSGEMKAAKIMEFYNRLKEATSLYEINDLIFATKHIHESICASRSWLGFGRVTSENFFKQFLTETKNLLAADKAQEKAYKPQ